MLSMGKLGQAFGTVGGGALAGRVSKIIIDGLVNWGYSKTT